MSNLDRNGHKQEPQIYLFELLKLTMVFLDLDHVNGPLVRSVTTNDFEEDKTVFVQQAQKLSFDGS